MSRSQPQPDGPHGGDGAGGIAHAGAGARPPWSRVDNGGMTAPLTSAADGPTPDDEAAATAHDLATLARAAATAVAPYLRSVARTVTTFETKADVHDPVTVHDRRVEEALHALLAHMVPGSRVLGEETGEHVLPVEPQRLGAGFTDHFVVPTSPQVQGARRRRAALGERVRWIIDPIDGTANFAAGLAYFNTSVAAELDGRVVAGAISVPMGHEVFVADARRCWREGPGGTADLHADGPDREDRALLITYYPGRAMLTRHPARSLAHETLLVGAYQATRRPGAAALDLAMVAAGWCGAMLGTSFKPWDVAAGIHLVRVAGGRVLNLPLGTDLPDGLRPGIVASARQLDAGTAASVLRELDEAARRP